MSYISDIWLYPLQDWWRTVNEMSNFLHTGEIGNFIFRPVNWVDGCTLIPVYVHLQNYVEKPASIMKIL